MDGHPVLGTSLPLIPSVCATIYNGSTTELGYVYLTLSHEESRKTTILKLSVRLRVAHSLLATENINQVLWAHFTHWTDQRHPPPANPTSAGVLRSLRVCTRQGPNSFHKRREISESPRVDRI